MVKFHLIFLMLVAILGIGCNSGDETDLGPAVGRVNKNIVYEKEFRQNLYSMQYYSDVKAISLEERKYLLMQQLEKKLLVDEAMQLGLHKQPEFRRKIQDFWEQSLISMLIQIKNKQIDGQLMVTEEEVEFRCNQLRQGDPSITVTDSIRDEMVKKIMEEKRTMTLETYLTDLKKKAEIVVFEDNLKAMR